MSSVSAKLDILLEKTNGLTEEIDRITKELEEMGFRMRKSIVMKIQRSRPNISTMLGEEKILYRYGVPTLTKKEHSIWKILYGK